MSSVSKKEKTRKEFFKSNGKIYILSLRSAIKFNVSFVNKRYLFRRSKMCVEATKQCTVRNMMLTRAKLERIKLCNLNKHYANKKVSLPMLVSATKIQ